MYHIDQREISALIIAHFDPLFREWVSNLNYLRDGLISYTPRTESDITRIYFDYSSEYTPFVCKVFYKNRKETTTVFTKDTIKDVLEKFKPGPRPAITTDADIWVAINRLATLAERSHV